MPESARQDTARWHVAGWTLRTKVAVVLVVPAIVALVLGGVRVQGQLDNANRLSAVRDQLTVLTEAVTLSDLVAQEMVTAVSPGATGLEERTDAVDRQIAVLDDAADFAALPATVDGDLNAALGRLAGLREQAGTSPVAVTAGYREVLTALADLFPAVVSLARNEDLDDRATTVRSLLALRATLATETALIQSDVDGLARLASAQDAAAEESVLGQQLLADLPPATASQFEAATRTAEARRDALQNALAGNRVSALPNLLPGLETTDTALKALLGNVYGDLSDTVTARTNDARSDALRDSAIVLAALLAALAVALTVARSLLSPLNRLRTAALEAAHEQLPKTVERVRAGEQVDFRTVEPVPVHTQEEIGQLARAFDDMHRQAVRLAGEQAELRLQVSEMFMTLSRRSQSLVELQLGVIEELEADEQDPQRLSGLFRLDHLATRLRRNGENLQVLAGGTPPRRGNRPVSVVELLRAATSEITDYRRVTLGNAPNGSVRSSAAADLVHILAELLENATRFSPPDRKVVLTADRGSHGGLLFEVVDGGLGMAEEDLAAANERLATPDSVGPETTRRMGLFVVSQLAARHGVTVRLRPTYDSSNQAGVTASIHVPGSLVIADGTPALTPAPAPELAPEPALAAIGGRLDLPPIPQPVPIPEPALNGHSASWFTPVIEVDEQETNGHAVPTWPSEPEVAPPPVREPVAPETPPLREHTWESLEQPPVRETTREAIGPPPASEPVGTTASGLPMRRPGSNIAPELPTERPTERPLERPADRRPEPRTDFRDPETIRSNLSRHYSGMQAARRARQESDTAAPERHA